MSKKFQIVLMIFCLGIFIFPKQVFSLEMANTSCCKTEKTPKDCCGKSEKSSPCQDSKSQKHSCDGNCSNCSSCSLTVVFIGENSPVADLQPIQQISKKVENFYLTPYFSQLSQSIWQPPKLG